MGILEAAPQFHVLVTRFGQSEQLAQLQRRSIARYPNVSIIDLDLIPLNGRRHLGQGLLCRAAAGPL